MCWDCGVWENDEGSCHFGAWAQVSAMLHFAIILSVFAYKWQTSAISILLLVLNDELFPKFPHR